jgi:hypothetical protein
VGLIVAALAPAPPPVGAVVSAPKDTSMPWGLQLRWGGGAYCSGFMLTEHWLVTAAHCIDDRDHRDTVTVSTMEDGRRVTAYRSGTASYYPHPSYLSDPSVENDIGIVRLFGAGAVPELRAPLYADSLTQPPYAWRGFTDFAYIAGYGRGSDPGGASDCDDDDVTTGTRRLGVLGLTGDALPATGTPLAVQANPQIGTPCNGDSGSPWTFRKEWKNFVFAVHSGGTDSVKNGTLLHPKMQWITNTAAAAGLPMHCPAFIDGDTDLRFRQCTEGHRMLVREGTGSPTVWRVGSSDLAGVYVGDVDGDGSDDLLRLAADRFFVSYAGRSVWSPTPATYVSGATFAYGDFDGNGTMDILRSINGSWHAMYSRADRTWSSWVITRLTNDRLGNQVLVGDFDGDGVDDLFTTRFGEFVVSWSARGGGSNTSWRLVQSSSAQVISLQAGDFDGNGADEVFYANGSTWRVSFSPHSRGLWTRWVTVASSQYVDLKVADFDENGTTDIIRSTGAEWRVSYSTRTRATWSTWTRLRYSTVSIRAAAFGNFDRTGGTDGLYLARCPQYC